MFPRENRSFLVGGGGGSKTLSDNLYRVITIFQGIDKRILIAQVRRTATLSKMAAS